jgi:hypothetical protein
MPGGWLRLRGGRKLYLDAGSGTFENIHEFRRSVVGGGIFHIVEHGGAWKRLNLGAFPAGLTALETINTTFQPEPGAITTVKDKVFWSNGMGIRGTGGALSSWDGTTVRFVGLDAFAPGSAPVAAFTPDAGGATKILFHRRFAVGLYNQDTGHFGNAVDAGSITNPDIETTYTGNLSVGSLGNLSHVTHGAGETSGLFYVIYATLDGGEVYYLVLNEDGTGPLTTAVGGGSVSIELDDNADFGDVHIVDSTQERPLENFPPRPMRLISYANGRVYGALMAGGSGSNKNNFSFVVPFKDETAMTWSASADDVQDREFVGEPTESFPLTNKKHTPNGEIPIVVAPPQGDLGSILVITKTGTYFLEETLPGVHIWRKVSEVDGIHSIRTFAKTQYGYVWMTQNRELVLLPPNEDSLRYISKAYNSLFRDGAINAADYLRDPAQYIDRYQIWLSDNTSVIHDFTMRRGDIPEFEWGQAYRTSNQNVSIAKSVLDAFGQKFSLMAIGSRLYCQEADPFTRIVPTTDEEASGVFTQINGEWIGQWLDFGDDEERKEFKYVDVLGDAAFSQQLSADPLAIYWYKDFDDTEFAIGGVHKTPQSPSDKTYRGKPTEGNAFWFKFRITLSGHSTDNNATYYAWLAAGEKSPNVYGSILRFALGVFKHGNKR